METDLINKYIEKLNDNVCELTKKVIVLEVQLHMAGDRERQREEDFIAKETQLHTQFSEEMEVVRDDFNKRLERETAEFKRELNQIIAQRIGLQDECNELRRKLASVTETLDKVIAERAAEVESKISNPNPRRKKKDDSSF